MIKEDLKKLFNDITDNIDYKKLNNKKNNVVKSIKDKSRQKLKDFLNEK